MENIRHVDDFTCFRVVHIFSRGSDLNGTGDVELVKFDVMGTLLNGHVRLSQKHVVGKGDGLVNYSLKGFQNGWNILHRVFGLIELLINHTYTQLIKCQIQVLVLVTDFKRDHEYLIKGAPFKLVDPQVHVHINQVEQILYLS